MKIKDNIKSKAKNLFIGLMLVLLLNTACYAEYDPKAIKAYNSGIDLTSQEKYNDAILSLEEATQIEPSFTDAYYNLGILYQYLGNMDKALGAYQAILQYNPKDYEVIQKIAVIHYNKGNKEKAAEYIKKIPTTDPNYGLIAELMKTVESAKIQAEKTYQIKSVKKCETYSGFEGPTGIVRDSKGNLYVANFSDNSIVYLNNSGERKVLAKDGAIKGPLGLAIDKNDNIYVANYESNQIVVIPANDKTPKVLPFIVKKPYFLMVDNSGMLYVTEQGTNSVSQHYLELK